MSDIEALIVKASQDLQGAPNDLELETTLLAAVGA